MYTCELPTSPPLVSRHELKVVAGRRVIQLEPEHRDYHRSDLSTSCCLSKNVTSACQALCQPHSPASSLVGCEAELGTVYSCVAASQDQARCCQDSGVPGECSGPCSGQISDNLASQCHTFAPAILSCLLTGIQAVPGSPVAVSASPMDDNTISVSWMADPASLHLVHHFNLNLTFIA